MREETAAMKQSWLDAQTKFREKELELRKEELDLRRREGDRAGVLETKMSSMEQTQQQILFLLQNLNTNS